MTIPMDQLDAWTAEHVARWVPGALGLCVPVLLAWFPGFNARRRAHGGAPYISAASWGLALLVAWVAVVWDRDVVALLLPAVMVWLGLVVWSYGKRDRVLPVAAPARGFEITVLCPLELLAPE